MGSSVWSCSTLFPPCTSGKGLPKQAGAGKGARTGRSGEVDGQFNMELFRAFSSMQNGKGLPKQADVETMVGWKFWREWMGNSI